MIGDGVKMIGYGSVVIGAGVGSGGYGSVVCAGPGVGGMGVGSVVAGGAPVGGIAVTVGVGVGVAGAVSVAFGGRYGVTCTIPGVRVGVGVGALDFLQAAGKNSKSRLRLNSRIACQIVFLG